MTKKIIEAVAYDDVKYRLCGSLSEVLAEVKELIKEYGENARLNIDAEYSDYYSDTRYAYARVYVKREETDAEYEKRIKMEQKLAADREAHERATYERLHKQFGGQK